MRVAVEPVRSSTTRFAKLQGVPLDRSFEYETTGSSGLRDLYHCGSFPEEDPCERRITARSLQAFVVPIRV